MLWPSRAQRAGEGEYNNIYLHSQSTSNAASIPLSRCAVQALVVLLSKASFFEGPFGGLGKSCNGYELRTRLELFLRHEWGFGYW